MKKLLIALFVVVTACLLAFSVSASNEVTLVGGEQADLTTVFKVNASNQITGFNDGYTKDSVTDVIFPDYIEGLEANYLFGEAKNLNTVTFAATDTFFISGDGIFSKCSVKKVTFDPNCVVELRKGNFSSCTSLTEITFPKFSKLAGSAFAYCSNMTSTNELVLAEGMTEIGGHAFQSCSSLSGTVVFPSTLEKIQEYSFEKTGFTGFDLSKCASLSVAGGGYGGPFTDNDKITSIDLSGCTSLTYLKNSFVANCDNLTEIILPPNLETIESKAIAHCYKLQSIVFPATMKTVADEAFHSARSGQTIKTFTVYIQSDVVMGASYPFRDSSAKIEYVLIGDKVTAESFKAKNTFTGVTEATVVDYLDEASPWTYVTGQTITSHTIVENYCKPFAINGEHAFVGNPCVVNCTYCKLKTLKENPEHNDLAEITYSNGYTNVGSYVGVCQNEGCGHKTEKEALALFVCLGYSAPEGEKLGIAIEYKVNKDAIKEYVEVTGKTFEYGVFAVSKTKLGENTIFDNEGNATSGVISTELSSYDFSSVLLKITGFKDEHKDKEFALGVYTSFDGNYGYIQENSAVVNDAYVFTSYNAIIDGINKQKEVA